jgi:mono/diheme cytochrome c family protein
MRKVQLLFLLLFLGSLAAGAQAKKPAASAGSKSTVQATINRGKLVYGANCLTCHQADGSGVGNLNPPLYGTQWISGSKTALVQMILKGSKGKVEIDGETFHNAMPAQPHLTDQQIADVLTYVRNSFGNKASPVTPAEVKSIRAKAK